MKDVTEMTDLLQFIISVQKSHEQHEIFAHELQIALKLTDFLNIYCEP
jgi:hypothetical protein